MTTSDDRHGVPRPVPWDEPLPGSTVCWRRAQLRAAGYDEFSAHRMAVDPSVDVHLAVLRAEAGDDGQGRAAPAADGQAVWSK